MVENQDGRSYFVYIMSNNSGITYVGITNDIFRRVHEHKNGVFSGFSKVHGTHKLVYYEEYEYVEDAILCEKQIKSWRKAKKRALIRSSNPKWRENKSPAWLV